MGRKNINWTLCLKQMNYDHSDKSMFFFSLVGIAKFKYISQAVLEVDGNAN